ncbi:hypothetical protein M406DRAFT_324988 [Cryphonectria parasitica EP155]|uniref:Uncharacterized protein n=1 Tax=Cryphonectria parasitica (strain ATCC 38755 / EP155) TaxID=660469 RepID=A0A9P4YAK0_CRYP1|nr:uncharacterized protein M406DRAFT_324988 [Cryphonectria parasitica EP155]KAF3769481.1 hypothetical protein M406DRAFT_324988 [Cryphonectria parasitica EP155]
MIMGPKKIFVAYMASTAAALSNVVVSATTNTVLAWPTSLPGHGNLDVNISAMALDTGSTVLLDLINTNAIPGTFSLTKEGKTPCVDPFNFDVTDSVNGKLCLDGNVTYESVNRWLHGLSQLNLDANPNESSLHYNIEIKYMVHVSMPRVIYSTRMAPTFISPTDLNAVMAPVILAGPDSIQPWLNSLVRRARHSGCQHILFPSSSQSKSLPLHQFQHRDHLQGIQNRLQRETAGRLVRESVPGYIWAYMLTLVVHPDELFADPALSVGIAQVAAARVPDAPVTEREWARLSYELKGACPDDYPTRAHYEQGQKWLSTVTKRHRLGQGQV